MLKTYLREACQGDSCLQLLILKSDVLYQISQDVGAIGPEKCLRAAEGWRGIRSASRNRRCRLFPE